MSPGRAFFAEHGSWDRTLPSGYEVASIALPDPLIPTGTAAPEPGPIEPFLSGFRLDPPLRCNHDSDCPMRSLCQSRNPTQVEYYCGGIGRPADIEVLLDGR